MLLILATITGTIAGISSQFKIPQKFLAVVDSSVSFSVCRYVYCVKCFQEIQGDTVTVGDDPLTATRIPKKDFKEVKNNSIDREK